MTPRKFRNLVHILLDNRRVGVIELVDRFAALEIDVRVLGCSTHRRTVRRHRAFAASLHILLIDDFPNHAIFESLDFHHFVRSAETVKEVHRRDAAFERRSVGDKGEILAFLHRRGAEHRKARLAASHHIGMVSENRKPLGCEGTRGHMKDCRGEFARNLIHVRNHQEKPLGRRKCRRQSAGLQGSVHRACGPPFGLHFKYTGNLSPDILLPGGAPVVGMFSHGTRRCNRINRSDFAHLKRYIRSRFVSIDRNHFFSHKHLQKYVNISND